MVNCIILTIAARKPVGKSSSFNWLAATKWDWLWQNGDEHPNETRTDRQPRRNDTWANHHACATQSMHFITCFCSFKFVGKISQEEKSIIALIL